jgi:hypothetical protein
MDVHETWKKESELFQKACRSTEVSFGDISCRLIGGITTNRPKNELMVRGYPK